MTTRKNILLVDDEKNFLMSLSEGLGTLNKNLNVLTAEDGEEAMEILNSSKIDLLITDLKMPKKDGFDLLKHVLKYNPSMPAIVMTAHYDENMFRGLNVIGWQCLEKPLDLDELSEQVSGLLEKVDQVCL